MVVALGAIQSDAEERPRCAAGQPHSVGGVFVGRVERADDEIAGRLVGGEAVGGDQVADDGVIGPVLHQLVAEPGGEAMAAVDEGRAVIDADGGAGETFGQVVAVAAILEGAAQPPFVSFRRRISLDSRRLVLANFLHRGDRPREAQGRAADHRQLRCFGCGIQACGLPRLGKQVVNLADDAGELRVADTIGVEILAARRHRGWEEQPPQSGRPGADRHQKNQVSHPHTFGLTLLYRLPLRKAHVSIIR